MTFHSIQKAQPFAELCLFRARERNLYLGIEKSVHIKEVGPGFQFMIVEGSSQRIFELERVHCNCNEKTSKLLEKHSWWNFFSLVRNKVSQGQLLLQKISIVSVSLRISQNFYEQLFKRITTVDCVCNKNCCCYSIAINN